MRIGIYTGQYFDEETGLHYNYHRYYDPKTGRYLTPDPIGLEGGINLYTYAHNNPIRHTDSLGLDIDPQPGVKYPWVFGIQVHKLFTEWVKSQGYDGNNTLQGLFGKFRPDAYDNINQRIWELKPASWQKGYKYNQAQSQLEKYLHAANSNDPFGNWGVGGCGDLLGGRSDVLIGEVTHMGDKFDIYLYPDLNNPGSGLIFYRFSLTSTFKERFEKTVRDGTRMYNEGPLPMRYPVFAY